MREQDSSSRVDMPRRLQHITSVAGMSAVEIMAIHERANALLSDLPEPKVERVIMCSAFFTSSTRTRFGFESAMLRLGGRVLQFDYHASRAASSWKETVFDTMKMLNGMADVAVMRTSSSVEFADAVEAASIPIINAGNGVGDNSEHPTQALADIHWILNRFGNLDQLKILLIGPLRDRLTRSMLIGLDRLGLQEIWLACPEESVDITTPKECSQMIVRVVEDIRGQLANFDIVYHNGVSEDGASMAPARLSILPDDVRCMAPQSVVLHPMPRSFEMPRTIDLLPQAQYFNQAASAMNFRKALLLHALQL